MKRFAIAMLTVCAVFTASSAHAETVTLDEAMARAMKRPAAVANDDQAEAARELAAAERRAALFPSLSVSASAEQRSRKLTLAMGPSTLEISDKQRLAGQVGVRQPILDGARLFYTAPAARLDAKAAAMSSARSKEELAAFAAAAYFNVLEIDARRGAIEANIARLKSRLVELDALIVEGKAIDRDRRRLRLSLDDAELAAGNLNRQREVATLALGVAIGETIAVEPARLEALPSSEATGSAQIRSDLAALSYRRDALLKRRDGVRAELLPIVSLEGAWIYDDALFADQDNFFVVSLNLRWTPLASGTRSSRRRALAAQAAALSRQKAETQRAIKLEIAQARADMLSAAAAKTVATRGVEDARESLRVTGERFRSGRETIGDLLEVEALLRDRQTILAVAEIDVRRADIANKLAAGTIDSSSK